MQIESSNVSEILVHAISSTRNNGSFVPHEVARKYCLDKYGYVNPLRFNQILEILSDPIAPLYPDVPEFMQTLANSGMTAMFWTQGEGNAEVPKGQNRIGFQPAKIKASGLLEMVNPAWAEWLQNIGLQLDEGGFDKTSDGILSKLTERLISAGVCHIEICDDRLYNLVKAGRFLEQTECSFGLNLIDREHKEREQVEAAGIPITVCDSLDGIIQFPYPLRTHFLLDVDHTLIDTHMIKENFAQRLEILAD